jgi:hypothetical protein
VLFERLQDLVRVEAEIRMTCPNMSHSTCANARQTCSLVRSACSRRRAFVERAIDDTFR